MATTLLPSRIVIMSFADRLVAARKARQLTQAKLSKITGVYVSMIKRYEQGDGEPSLAILRKLARGLNVASDELLFEEGEREPVDDLKMMFEAVDQFDDKEKANAKELIKILILRNQANKWAVNA